MEQVIKHNIIGLTFPTHIYNPHSVYGASKDIKESEDGADNKAPTIPQKVTTI